jgi:hypothetical protein
MQETLQRDETGEIDMNKELVTAYGLMGVPVLSAFVALGFATSARTAFLAFLGLVLIAMFIVGWYMFLKYVIFK